MIRAACVLALSLAVVTACAAPAPRAPVADRRFGAPEVVAPRDVRGGDPCGGLLDSADLVAMGLSTRGRPKVLQTGDRGCDWRTTGGDGYLTLIVIPDRDVLVDTYRTRQYPVFQPIQVAGLPATREQSFVGSMTCTVTVGTAIGQGFISDYTGAASCDGAQRAAEHVALALPPLPG
ncbi:hypothetical protein GCM10023200_17130 [Actinomycetospora chlora]|uniref:DUF3558 domain-containing protein n=1 Tax=Actinomycetospora chlora TaxID=663608 RepID=A0ABP9APJ9_9PSEU